MQTIHSCTFLFSVKPNNLSYLNECFSAINKSKLQIPSFLILAKQWSFAEQVCH